MIEIVTRFNRQAFASQMEQMFRQRYSVFVEQLNWDLPEAKDGLEVDEFDTDDTIYLLSIDRKGRLQGSKRLNPTMAPHLMSGKFPHLVEGEVPRGPHIWESSRSCIPASGRGNGVIGQLFLAMVETSLLFGVRQITFVAGMDFYQTIIRAGWGHVPLGYPQPDASGEDNIAGSLIIDPIALHNMRRKYGIMQPVVNTAAASIAA